LGTRTPAHHYANAEDSSYVEDPGHVDLLKMLKDLNTIDNPSFAVYPYDKTLDRSISAYSSRDEFGRMPSSTIRNARWRCWSSR
jgi:hypothetical protein